MEIMERVPVQGLQYNYELPDSCPRCRRNVEPTRLAFNVQRFGGDQERLEIVFRCPSSACQAAFIAGYVRIGMARDRTFRLGSLAPRSPDPPIVRDEVVAISPAYQFYSRSLRPPKTWGSIRSPALVIARGSNSS